MARIIDRDKKLPKLHNYKTKIKSEESFKCVIAPVIFIAQIFGFFPINRLFSKNISNVTFKWISFTALYSLIWFIFCTICCFLELYRLCKAGYNNAKDLGGTIYYGSNWISSIFMIKLATEFPKILKRWHETEEKFLSEPYANSGISLKKQIRILASIVFPFAILENLFSNISFVHDRYKQAQICKWELGDTMAYYITTHLSHIYMVIPYNPVFAIWIEYVNTSITVVWNYIDIIIMVFSIGIAFQFRQINYRLQYFKGRIMPESTWGEIRLHYVSVCELQEMIDRYLANLIIIASLSDLYSVCAQFLNVAIKLPYTINTIYFWYSFLYLIGRTLGLFLCASMIHDESRFPLKILRSIPTEGWFSEVERFCHQVQTETVALTGRRFFTLTRSLVISIAGTIITYELVLLQFDAEKVEPGMFKPCGDHMPMVENATTTTMQP